MLLQQAKNRANTVQDLAKASNKVALQALFMTKTSAWECVQDRERWSPEEEVHTTNKTVLS